VSSFRNTGGLVAVTSASHAEGCQLDPVQVYFEFLIQVQLLSKYGDPSFLGALELPGLAKHPSQDVSFKASGIASAASLA
jgi:hypothetical protein